MKKENESKQRIHLSLYTFPRRVMVKSLKSTFTLEFTTYDRAL